MTERGNRPTIREARDEADRQAIFRFRYDIYVEEMNRYRAIADHERRVLIEPDDQYSRHYLAESDGEVVAVMRLTWGGDSDFTERHIQQYDLARFLAEIPARDCIIGERFMVTRAMRGTDLLFRLFTTYLKFVNQQRIQLIFGDCEPHLLNLYQGLGFRTYSQHHVNSSETGYLIPLMMVSEDLDYFRAIKSPLISVLEDFGEDNRVPPPTERLLAEGSGVVSQRLTPSQSYWSNINDTLQALGDRQSTVFDGLSEEEAALCIDKSNIIACRRGDRLIKKGNVAQNMYVVLEGTLEVMDGDHLLALLSPGDVIGEMAFFLEVPRTADVYAAGDDVRVLSLSESAVRKIIAANPEVAARLLLNLSKLLCLKLMKMS